MDGFDRKETITTEIVWHNGVLIIWTEFTGMMTNLVISCVIGGSVQKVLQATVMHPHALNGIENFPGLPLSIISLLQIVGNLMILLRIVSHNISSNSTPYICDLLERNDWLNGLIYI